MTKLHPDWIQGFIEGDGHFGSPRPQPQEAGASLKAAPRHKFVVSQDKISVNVLYALKSFFQCGNVHKAGGSMTEYSVGDRKNLIEKIIKFFDQRVFVVEPDYKKNQYLNFRLSLLSLRPGTPGLLDACDPAGTTFDRNARSSDQETAKHFQQPSLETRTDPLSPEWLAGFIDAEGCFYVAIFPSREVRIGMRVIPKFFIGLSEKEEKTIKKIQQALGVGRIRQRKDKSWIFEVSALGDLSQIPGTFDQKSGKRSLLKTNKRIVYNHWREIILIMNQKGHLLDQGLKKILKRKKLMGAKGDEAKK